MKYWTPEEDKRLRQLYLDMSHADIGALLGRAESAVRNRCYRLKLRKKADLWTRIEVETLTAYYAERRGHFVDLIVLGQLMGRGKMSVALKASELGLTEFIRPKVEERKIRKPKYTTAEERNIGSKAAHKEWYKTHDHPRGALGLKHTVESRKKMSDATRRWLETTTPEQRSESAHKAVMTRIERYGTGRVSHGNPYSNARRGKRPDLGNIFFRSRWEANYARYLNWLMAQGQIADWKFEPKTFVFPGITRGAITYLPDFQVFELGGGYVWHEVKGWMKPADRTRLKRMAKFYPDEAVIVIAEPEYRAIENAVAGLIPNWEYKDDKHWVNW